MVEGKTKRMAVVASETTPMPAKSVMMAVWHITHAV
jgi:hypothetical protein